MAEYAEKTKVFSPAEYLEMEAGAVGKSEYFAGEIFAMTGGSPDHSIICFNLNRRIGEAIHSKDCRRFESNMKLDIRDAHAFVYPDVMVVCGEMTLSSATPDAITNPTLIIEVLSPTTESFDRGQKFAYYRSIPSLMEYVLVSQNHAKIEAYFRQSQTVWQYTVVEGFESAIRLETIAAEVRLADVYYKTSLAKTM